MPSNVPQQGAPPPPPNWGNQQPGWGGAPPPPRWDAQQSGGPVRYAGFWLRFLAWLIDTIIIFVIIWLLSLIVGADAMSVTLSEAEMQRAFEAGRFFEAMPKYTALGVISSVVIIWAYYALQESSSAQASLGKRALGLKVVDANGARLNLVAATIRSSFLWAPSLLGLADSTLQLLLSLVVLLSFIAIAFSSRKQGLHDRIAGAFIIRN